MLTPVHLKGGVFLLRVWRARIPNNSVNLHDSCVRERSLRPSIRRKTPLKKQS